MKRVWIFLTMAVVLAGCSPTQEEWINRAGKGIDYEAQYSGSLVATAMDALDRNRDGAFDDFELDVVRTLEGRNLDDEGQSRDLNAAYIRTALNALKADLSATEQKREDLRVAQQRAEKLRRKTIVIALLLVCMGGGAFQYMTMSRRADPAFTIRVAQVMTRWPGAPADRVEQLVTGPLEESIGALEEVDVVFSTTSTGLSVIKVELADSLPVEDIPQTWERVRAKVAKVRPALPLGVQEPVVNDEFGDTSVMLLAVYEKPHTGPARYSMRQLEVISKRVREAIASLENVASADIHGEQAEVIHLVTSKGGWANLDLTLAELRGILQAQNTTATGGTIETDRSQFSVLPSGEFDTVAQIESVVVGRSESGAPVRLRDLDIEVRREYQDPPAVRARYGNVDGDAPCVIVSYTMKAGVKVTDLNDEVQQLVHSLQQEQKRVPPDVAVDVVFDEGAFVEGKISDFTNNVLEAIIIVVGVALVMAGLRSAVVMAAAIPFVMVISIGVASLFGVGLEQMSIASLIIALGMLVDNAVVVCDNVRRFQADGFSRLEAVCQGVEQIQYPILMGTLTTVFAFLPLAFALSGSRAEYIYSIPVVVSTTLLVSWVLALTVTSLMAYWVIRPRLDGTVRRSPLEQLAGLLSRLLRSERSISPANAYGVVVARFLAAKPVVLVAAILLLAGSLMLPIGSEFFPDDNRDVLYIDVWLPEGASITKTDQAARRVEALLRELSAAESDDGNDGERLSCYYTSIGGSGPKFTLGVSPNPPQSNFAQIIVRTTDASVTDSYVNAIRTAAERRVPGARVLVRKLALGPPVDFPVAVRITGSSLTQPGFVDETELRRQADHLKRLFASIEGLRDVHDSWGDPGYELGLETHSQRANLAGVTNASVAESFAAYYSGEYLTMYRQGDQTIPVYLRLSSEQRGKIQDPRTLFVEGASGKVPVDSVASIQPRRATSRIERYAKNRAIEVRAGVDPGQLPNKMLAQAMPEIRRLEAMLPTGFHYQIAGAQEKTGEAQAEMVAAFGIAFILIVLCLIVQYNSFIKPFVVLTTVPMGAAGGLLGLWVTGNALGFMPMLGLVALAGIVVNSGILYVEFADNFIRQKLVSGEGLAAPGERSYNGLTRSVFRRCLVDAGRLRMLPIFLTAITTVGGMIPLALFGGPLWEGMAYLMIFGLITATLLTLLVLPTIYAATVEYLRLNLVPPPPMDNDEPSDKDNQTS